MKCKWFRFLLVIAVSSCLIAPVSAAVTKFSVSPPANGDDDFDRVYLSPDAQTVILPGELTGSDDVIFRVPFNGGAGGTRTQLIPNTDIDVDGDVAFFETGGATKVIYDSDRLGIGGGDNDGNLWVMQDITDDLNTASTPLTNLTTTPLDIGYPTVSPDNTTLFFRMETVDLVDPTDPTDEVSDDGIYSLSLTGSFPVAAAPLLTPASLFVHAPQFDLSADGSTLVFGGGTVSSGSTDPGAGDATDIYTMSSAGGAATAIPITASPAAGFDIEAVQFLDANTVIFIGDYETDGVVELFTVPIAGGTPTKINNISPVAGGDIQNMYISPDGTMVAYVGDILTNGDDELFLSKVTGGASIKLNPTLVTSGDVEDNLTGAVAWLPDSSGLIFLGDVETNGITEAFLATLDFDADFDGDLDVDGDDFLIWQRNLGTGTTNAEGDADGDGDVDSDDLNIWQFTYGDTVPPLAATSAVPEPTSVVLVMAGLLAGSGMRRRRS